MLFYFKGSGQEWVIALKRNMTCEEKLVLLIFPAENVWLKAFLSCLPFVCNIQSKTRIPNKYAKLDFYLFFCFPDSSYLLQVSGFEIIQASVSAIRATIILEKKASESSFIFLARAVLL